jgi:hypothetical protein
MKMTQALCIGAIILILWGWILILQSEVQTLEYVLADVADLQVQMAKCQSVALEAVELLLRHENCRQDGIEQIVARVLEIEQMAYWTGELAIGGSDEGSRSGEKVLEDQEGEGSLRERSEGAESDKKIENQN